MKFNPRDEPVAPIFQHSIDAFGQELSSFFRGRETPVFLLKQQGDLDEVRRTSPNIKPPLFTYRPGDVALFEEGASNEKTQRHGFNSGGPRSAVDSSGRPIDPNKNYIRLNYVYVEVNITVEYICSYIEQIEFSQIWIPLSVRPVTFELDYKGITIPCWMLFDKSITYSDADFDNDTLTNCQTSCVLRTYMATEGVTRPITRYHVPEKLLGEAVGDSEGHRRYTEFFIDKNDDGDTEVES